MFPQILTNWIHARSFFSELERWFDLSFADTGSAGVANCLFDFKAWVEWVHRGSRLPETQSTESAGMKQENTYPDTDETNQGRSEQSQKNETQMEGVGRNTTGWSDGVMSGVWVRRPPPDRQTSLSVLPTASLLVSPQMLERPKGVGGWL